MLDCTSFDRIYRDKKGINISGALFSFVFFFHKFPNVEVCTRIGLKVTGEQPKTLA